MNGEKSNEASDTNFTSQGRISDEEKAKMQGRRQRFEAMPDELKQRIRDLHNTIESRSDRDELVNKHALRLERNLRRGDLDAAYEIYQRYEERVLARIDRVELLAMPSDPTPIPRQRLRGFQRALKGFDPAALQGMSPAQMMEAAAQVMQQMPPEQLEAMRQQLEGMSEEDRAKMLEQAKAMGLL